MGKLVYNNNPFQSNIMRYIYDCFMIWSVSEHELDSFVLYINSKITSIKFTMKKYIFLDVKVTKINKLLHEQNYKHNTFVFAPIFYELNSKI